MTILLLLAPGLLASLYYCRIRNTPVRSMEFVVYAILFSFLINLFVFAVAWLRGSAGETPASLFSSTGRVIQYGLLGLLAAFALPNILVLAGNLMQRGIK